MNRTIIVAGIARFCSLRGDYIIKERLETGQVQQITLKIKDTKVRLDDGDQTSALTDSEAGFLRS
jgi:hypothetical protein